MKSFLEFTQNLFEGVDDPGIFKAVFLAGGPGSGKSFVANRTLPNAILGLKLVNSDQQLEFLLKKNKIPSNMNRMSQTELERFTSARDRAKFITAKKEKLYVDGRLGLIIDGTGRDYAKINEKREELRKLGYDTYMIFVNTSLDVALERNRGRERSVDEKIVTQSWQDVQSNIGKFQNLFGGHNFVVVDNNKVNEDVLMKVYKGVKKFVDMPPQSQIAKQWIKQKLGENVERPCLTEAKIEGVLYKKLESALHNVLKTKTDMKSFKDVADFYVNSKMGKDPKQRARWDLFWAIESNLRNEITSEVYDKLNGNDSHIDSALKSITGIR